MRNPAECSLKGGCMQRTLRLSGKLGGPAVADNIQAIKSGQGIAFRPVANNAEAQEEQVFSLRTGPLRLGICCRHSQDEMRLDGQAPPRRLQSRL